MSAGTGKVAMLLGLFAPADIAWGLVEEVAAKLGHKKDRLPIKALLRKVFSYFQQNQMSFNKQELEKAKKDLNNLYLIKAVDDDRSRFAVHSLIRQFLQWKLAQKPDTNRLFRETFVMSLLDIAKQMPQSPTRDLIPEVAPAIPHLDMLSREMLDDIPNPEEDLGWVFTGIARFYEGQGLYALAEDPYQRRLIAVKEKLGDRHPSVATSLNNLAFLYNSQGKYDEAEPLSQQAFSLRRELLGDRHPDVAASLNNLAFLYKSQGKYDEAEPLYQQALSWRRELLGDRHPSVAASLNNLAFLYDSQGRYEEAEPLYQQALSLRRELLGDRHPDVAASLNNLAFLYKSQGKYDEAEPLYQQALSLRRELLGDRHPDVADSLSNLAALYYNTQRYSEALQSIQLAIQIYEQTLGTDHPTTQNALGWLQLIQNAM